MKIKQSSNGQSFGTRRHLVAASSRVRLDQKGQTLTEYVALLVLVSLGAVIATQKLGSAVNKAINKSTTRINAKIQFPDS